MPVPDVKVDHIDDEAMPQAIEQITQCPTDDQCIGNIAQTLRGCTAVHHNQQGYANGNGNAGKKPALPAAAVGQKTKGGTVVPRIVQIERREQRQGLPSIKCWRISCLLPKSTISTATTIHSQRSPVEK